VRGVAAGAGPDPQGAKEGGGGFGWVWGAQEPGGRPPPDALRAAEPRLGPGALVVVYDGDHWGPMSKRGMLESMQVPPSPRPRQTDSQRMVSSPHC